MDKIDSLMMIGNIILMYIYKLVTNLTGEQIALISIFISFVIYILGKRSELNLKKHDLKKEEYKKLIEFLEDIYIKKYELKKGGNLKNNKLKNNEEFQSKFFDLGSSLLLYGSKKIYRQYLFFRSMSSDEFIFSSKYYDKDDSLIIYVMADMLTTIRKEVGFNKYNDITLVEALGFFVNDIANNPVSKIKSYKAHYNIKMIKVQLFLNDIVFLVYVQKIYNAFIKPIGGILFELIKYFFCIGLRLIRLIFPRFLSKYQDRITSIKE